MIPPITIPPIVHEQIIERPAIPFITQSNSVFSDLPNARFIWEALLYVAKGQKEKAQQLLQQSSSLEEHPRSNPQTLDEFFEKLFLDVSWTDPEFLSYLNLLEGLGIKHHNAFLTMHDPQTEEQRIISLEENLSLIEKWSLSNINLQVVKWWLEMAQNDRKFLYHQFMVDQMNGVQNRVVQTFTLLHQLETEEDAALYVKRLAAIPQQLNSVLQFLEVSENKGIRLPRFILARVIHNFDIFLSDSPTENPLYTTLQNKFPDKLNAAASIIENEVYPAFKKLKNHLVNTMDNTTNDAGVWRLPDGDAFYRYCLKRETTTDLTPEEIHQLGLREVAKIQNEIRTLFAEEGFTDHSLTDLFHHLHSDDRFFYPNTNEGKEQCLQDFVKIIERSRKELGHLFNLKPKTGVDVKRTPKHEEESAPGAYYMPPSMDGSRPGAFFVTLFDTNELPKYHMQTLAIHEAEPGHHFHFGVQNDMDIPIIRKCLSFNAYIEGWALYTEKLAYENNFYTDNFSKIGHLQDELFRAVRLVVDTGIHHYRWTREEAIAWMEENLGYNHKTIINEVDRYIVMPGQACAYKIGQLKLLELRQRMKDKLGDKFDIRDFHDIVLKTAMVPLSILEEQI